MKILNENLQNKPQIKKDLPAVFNNSQVLDLVTWVATLDGKNMNEPQMYILVTELSTLINTRHRNLSMEDIHDAFRRGIAGDYGEYYSLSLKSFNQFLIGYKANKARKEEKENIKNSMSTSERADFIRAGLAKRGYKTGL